MNPALVFCMSAHVSEMGGDYNFEKRCTYSKIDLVSYIQGHSKKVEIIGRRGKLGPTLR